MVTVINAPSLNKLVAIVGRTLVSVLGLAAIAWLVLDRGNGSARGFVLLFLVLVAMMVIVFVPTALYEPMVVLRREGIEVVRWQSVLLRRGKVAAYPWQPFYPRARRGGRGGTWVELPLVDAEGCQRKLVFHFISLGDLQVALAAAAPGGSPARFP